MIKKIIKKIVAVAFWIIIWQLLALIVDSSLLVPTPLEVLKELLSLCATAEFWIIIAFSLMRITFGIVVSFVLGVVIGVLISKSELANLLISPLMSLVKATPVASFILLAILWIDRMVLPVFITALIVIPVVASNVCTGIKAVDKNLLEVTKVFKFSFFKTLKRLYVPAVYPYFMSACRSSLGLGWKAGIAAEVLVVPAFSIGKMIFDSKQYFETTQLFAWTVVVIILSVLVEFVFCSIFNHLGKTYERRVRKDA